MTMTCVVYGKTCLTIRFHLFGVNNDDTFKTNASSILNGHETNNAGTLPQSYHSIVSNGIMTKYGNPGEVFGETWQPWPLLGVNCHVYLVPFLLSC